jgi:hypothetical protein
MGWTAAETNTHQDHVIAHVIGATPENYFIWDETAYLVLDIGFIWNIYLDMEMGLLPHRLAMSELEVDPESLQTTKLECGPIEAVEMFVDGDERRLVLKCEDESIAIETSLSHRWTRIIPCPSVVD